MCVSYVLSVLLYALVCVLVYVCVCVCVCVFSKHKRSKFYKTYKTIVDIQQWASESANKLRR